MSASAPRLQQQKQGRERARVLRDGRQADRVEVAGTHAQMHTLALLWPSQRYKGRERASSRLLPSTAREACRKGKRDIDAAAQQTIRKLSPQ